MINYLLLEDNLAIEIFYYAVEFSLMINISKILGLLMKLAKLVRKNDDYSIVTDNVKIWTLADLLITDVRSNIKSIYDFLEDDTLIAFCGNVSYIEKEGIDLIIDLEWHDYDDKCPNKIIISKENFLNILGQWEEVYSQKPDEIIIEQDENGKISITGKFID